MKDTDVYYKILTNYTDIESITAIYAEVMENIKLLTEVKNLCRSKLTTHLQATGELKVKTNTVTFGWTKPKSKMKLDEKAWQDKMLGDGQLYQRIVQFQFEEAHIERLKEDCMIEHVPQPKLYIR